MILILAVLVILGVISWLVYTAHNKTTGRSTVTTSSNAPSSKQSDTKIPGTQSKASALHYAPNNNFNAGTYVPGSDGFNLAEIGSTEDLSNLPANIKGMVWVGLCNGVDSSFLYAVRPYVSNPRIFGYYLMDEPDPTGQYSSTCAATNIKAESDWIHANDPGKKTFIVVMSMSSSSSPTYVNTYNPKNSDIDLYGLDPYPCRSELNGCDYSYITKAVSAAEEGGIPVEDIVPVYQAFGGGGYKDDGDGSYLLPTPSEENQILSTWASAVPTPIFDMAYSWGAQNGDTALGTSAALQQVFAAHGSRPLY